MFRNIRQTRYKKKKNEKFKVVKPHYFVPSFIKISPNIQVMSTFTFIANIGGMLGLCMGFSFVTLVEIFYFLSNIFLESILMTK